MATRTYSRRDILGHIGGAGAAWSLGAAWADGQTVAPEQRPPARPTIPDTDRPAIGARHPFPVIEAKGTPFAIGATLGHALRQEIHTGIERRRQWFDGLKTLALSNQRKRLDGFAESIATHYPEIFAELRGLGHGADLPLDDILVLNCQVELGAMQAQRSENACSTLHLAAGDRLLLLHNEDGDNAYRDLMAIARLVPDGRPAVTALLYPGGIPGCVPAFNEAGLVMTTNYIGAKEVRIGIPRYVLGRAVLAAKSIDEAIAISRDRHLAYSFHMNLGSIPEKRLVAVDVAVGHHAVQETQGLFIQTNHFVLPASQSIDQPAFQPGGSSDSRYRILTKLSQTLPPLDQVTADDLLRLLQSHDAVTQPFSPCRHPDESNNGRTLATAVFDLGAGTLDLYEGNPCETIQRRIDWL